jgi:hypothetical protein
MATVRGHFDGRVVVLDEAAPVGGSVDVIVQFPEPHPEIKQGMPAEYYWDLSQSALRHVSASGSEEVLRQRGREIIPAPGLPPIPSPEEWQRRADILTSVLKEWMADESGYDEETWPELKAGLERNRKESGDFRKLFDE